MSINLNQIRREAKREIETQVLFEKCAELVYCELLQPLGW